ncbi:MULTISPECIES: alpha/beta fold hydrolase [Haloarcula]|uniref:alpha/beta fold hydrolase n=1 Tax=Haloarcula TaxID=2237 RepID=UPI0023ED5E37|nr:alpha/beta fold hydrolase [Halomicroarcula sp. XH51]
MNVRVYDDGADDDCLLVLGWGNRCRHENVRWLVDRVAERYRVHAVELPTHITDVRRQWVAPLERYLADADLDGVPVLAHSAGGLTAAHLESEVVTNRVYLSPWWGADPPLPEPVLRVIARLPITRPILPVGDLGSSDSIGDLATEAQLQDGPRAYSPAFVRTVARAHATLPPARENEVAFCTLTDEIVDPRAVGERLPAARVRLYDGGHELFSSSARTDHIDDVLAALASGPAAL